MSKNEARIIRRAHRRADNDRLAREARFWKHPRTAEQGIAYTKPINQAARGVFKKRPAATSVERPEIGDGK